MGEVIHHVEARTRRVALDAVKEGKVDIINRSAFLVAVDKVKDATTDTADRR